MKTPPSTSPSTSSEFLAGTAWEPALGRRCLISHASIFPLVLDSANRPFTPVEPSIHFNARLACVLLVLAFEPCALIAQTAQPEPAPMPPANQAPAPAQAPPPVPLPAQSSMPAATAAPPDPNALSDPNALPAQPPGAIYKEAMHPLDMVRMSLDNWSDAELGALGVGMHKAKEACDAAAPESYSGDDLYDLARLCSFGQDWNAANNAALDYVRSGVETHRAQAYALSVNALVHIDAMDLAVGTAHEMLRKLPYDAEVAYAIRYMKDALEQQPVQSGDSETLKLAEHEHEAILQALAAGVPLKAAHGDAVIGLGPLYDSAIDLAFLQRYTGNDAAAGAAFAEIEAALPKAAVLNPEDKQRIEAVRAQYSLLGAPLPAIAASRSLMSATARAQVNPDLGAATVLVLFPDWCVQCRNMMKTLTAFVVANRDVPVHAYGLMFHDESVTGAQPLPEAKLKEMQGTATLLVPAETTATFAALDYPLAIVTDKIGLVRFIGLVPSDAFKGDGYIAKVITRMAAKPAASTKTE